MVYTLCDYARIKTANVIAYVLWQSGQSHHTYMCSSLGDYLTNDDN